MSFTFICPSKAETACTGFLGGAERTLRGKHYRVEIFASGHEKPPFTMRLFKDGRQVWWKDVPPTIEKDAVAARNMIINIENMSRSKENQA